MALDGRRGSDFETYILYTAQLRLYRIGSGNVDQNYIASNGQNKDKTT